jgi:hypothetical protein
VIRVLRTLAPADESADSKRCSLRRQRPDQIHKLFPLLAEQHPVVGPVGENRHDEVVELLLKGRTATS